MTKQCTKNNKKHVTNNINNIKKIKHLTIKTKHIDRSSLKKCQIFYNIYIFKNI